MKIEEKENKVRAILDHIVGHDKENLVHHLINQVLVSAVLGLAITSVVKLARIHHDVKVLARDVEGHKKRHLL